MTHNFTVDTQNNLECASSQSTPTTPKSHKMVIVPTSVPATHSNESSTGRYPDFGFQQDDTVNSTRPRQASSSQSSSDVQFDSTGARVAFASLTENDASSAIDSTQSVNNTFTLLNGQVPAFEATVQPYLSTLPPQISQHSVFTLPKPSLVTAQRKPTLGSADSSNQPLAASSIDSIGSNHMVPAAANQTGAAIARAEVAPEHILSINDEADGEEDPDYDFM